MLSTLDWTVLIGTMAAIVAYGVYKTRGEQSVKGYLLGGNEGKWWTIGLSVMATQASAITFLSTPGQAYSDGMGFIQIYFGLPLALIVVCVFFIPIYYKLKVYTAYEYLESRFDVKTRTLAAIYFLIQRGMGAGITIFAPAIILSSILGWNLNATILIIGFLVILYTVSGGTKAVNQTQKVQMIVIMVGMAIAFTLLLGYLPDEMSLSKHCTLLVLRARWRYWIFPSMLTTDIQYGQAFWEDSSCPWHISEQISLRCNATLEVNRSRRVVLACSSMPCLRYQCNFSFYLQVSWSSFFTNTIRPRYSLIPQSTKRYTSQMEPNLMYCKRLTMSGLMKNKS